MVMDSFGWRISTLFISTVFFMASFSEASVSILCPNDTAAAPSSGETLLPVNFAFPTIVEDPSGIPVNASCSHEPGDMFPLTETVVSCMATDGMETAQCLFKVKVGEGSGCRVRLNQCICRLNTGTNTCRCKEGYTGVVCDIADGTTCGNGSIPVNQCDYSCPVSCGCKLGWQGPTCDVVDDGSLCDYEGVPIHCVLCFTGSAPPCICELGWKGATCANDYQPPKFIKCPGDTTGITTIGEDSANVTWYDPQAVDNAGGDPIITCDPKSGSIFTAGVTRVTCTATDDSSNSASDCVFSVTVSDNKTPDIFCPDSDIWNVDTASAVATVAWSPLPSANDSIDGRLNVTCRNNSGAIVESGNMFPVGMTMVTCSASDNSGNSATCSFNVTVLDTEGPVLVCSNNTNKNVEPGKPDSVVDLSPLPHAVDTVEGLVPYVQCADNEGNAVTSGDRFPAGETVVSCSAADSVGNRGNCSFIITVIDNEAPLMTCPRNTSQDIDPMSAFGTVDWLPSPTANDTIDGARDVQCSDDEGKLVNSGDKFPAGVTIVTCKASDRSNNEGSCNFVVTVTDDEAPIMACSESISQNVRPESAVAAVIWPTIPAANDTVDGPRVVNCTDDLGKPAKSGDEFPVGLTTVTCETSDSSGNVARCNFTVTVIDNEAPAVTCSMNFTRNVEPGKRDTAVNWYPLPAAKDAVEGLVPNVSCVEDGGEIVQSGSRFSVGMTKVTCSAMDSAGNEGNCSFVIAVIDNEPPFMTCPGNITQNVDKGSAFGTVIWPESPSANDTVDGQRIVLCSDAFSKPVSSGDTFPAGVNIVTCKTTDESNNEAVCNITITVTDNEPPIMTCPGNITENVDKGSAFGTVIWPKSPSANDTVDGQRIVLCSDAFSKPVSSGDTFPAGVNIVTCKATDESNNEAACNITITVTDNETPIMTCPANVSQDVDQGSAYASVDWPEMPTANDTVDGPQSVQCVNDTTDKLVNSGDAYPVGITRVTCNARDSTGNEGRCDFTVTVTDNEAPFVICPGEIGQNVELGKADAQVHWPSSLPRAWDVVEVVTPNVTCSREDGERVASGDRFTAGDTLVTCSTADSVGNEGNCSFVVTVIDNEAPILICPANLTINVNGNMATGTQDWPTSPSANDTVDGVLDVQCTDDTGRLVESGDGFPVGVILVTCAAYDRSNNEGNCSFMVTVTACEPCQNGGFSQDPQTCNCSCLDSYTGPLCSDCKECVNGNKQNRSTCSCECFNLYTGSLCDDCIECMNGGMNQDPDTCMCSCPGFYLPPLCEECESVDNCQNGGEFSEASCSCSCTSPFTGRNCTECQSCKNGGSYQNQFTCACDCLYFHTDPLCFVCPVEFTCLNGGTRDVPTCSCQCAAGWRGRDCSEPIPNLPDDEYPVSPLWIVVEKKVSFEVAVIAPMDKQCDPSTNKHSAACDALVAQFKIQVEIEYKYVSGFSHVNVYQDNLRSGSVVIPHEVVYKYNEMTPSTRGISANALYEETLGRAVDRGWIGTLRVASAGCNDCMAPKDNTNICNAIPPSCAPGLVLTKRADSRAGTCYYVCQSKCKVDPSYCGEGTCQQELGSEEIYCNCPQSSTLMHSGSQCQRRIHLVGLYVGVGVGGFIILLLIVVLSACLCRRRAEINKLDKTDQENKERYVYSTDLIGKLGDFQNGGHTRATYNHDYATQSTMELYSQVIKTPSRKPTNDSRVDGTKTPQHASSVQDTNGYQTRIGERRNWYFWGSQSLPKKQATEIIPMTSETGTF